MNWNGMVSGDKVRIMLITKNSISINKVKSLKDLNIDFWHIGATKLISSIILISKISIGHPIHLY
jgi:hypothetical protein